MTSPRKDARSAAADRLVGIKAIQRVLRERGVRVARTTLNRWRHQVTPSLRPPILLEILQARPVLTASRRALEAWVEKASRKRLFQRSQKNHETRERRRAFVALAKEKAAAAS